MPTRYRLTIVFVFLLAGIAWLWSLTNNPRMVAFMVGGDEYTVEVVNTPSARAKGLGHRESLATSTGMLFVFPEPDIYPFWMKDMEFPIDIVWIDNDWCVVNIAYSVAPSTYPDSFVPTAPASYVLEVRAGVMASKNIGVADCFQPPLI